MTIRLRPAEPSYITEPDLTRYRPSNNIHGWIVLLGDREDGYHASVVEIRENHSSLNMRCPAQHAFLMALQSDDPPGPSSADSSWRSLKASKRSTHFRVNLPRDRIARLIDAIGKALKE